MIEYFHLYVDLSFTHFGLNKSSESSLMDKVIVKLFFQDIQHYQKLCIKINQMILFPNQ